MKKEYLMYYFDKCFKGKVDVEQFNVAKNDLFFLLVYSKDESVLNTKLKKFINLYHYFCDDIQGKLDSMEEVANSGRYQCFSMVKKLSYKKHINNYKKALKNAEKFYASLVDVFGLAILNMKDTENAEEVVEQKNN